MNLARASLRFRCHVTLGGTGFRGRIARIPTLDRLPEMLGTAEVALKTPREVTSPLSLLAAPPSR